MKNNVDYSLYLCTDREIMSCKTIEESVELAIKGGCTVVQLREKNCPSLEFYNLALRVKDITKQYNVPLIINDRIDIALAVDADGVHIGQSDLPAKIARKIIGAGKILGVSASNRNEAINAQLDGADYLGVGAMYTTATKRDAKTVSMNELNEIRRIINIPIVVIGGINTNTIENFRGTGIDGVSVISAIIAQADIEGAAKELSSMIKSIM